MTHEEKINYMRIATGMAGFTIKNYHLDLLVSVYELVIEKEGKSSVDDVCKIEGGVRLREELRKKQELLDKVSDKINE